MTWIDRFCLGTIMFTTLLLAYYVPYYARQIIRLLEEAQ